MDLMLRNQYGEFKTCRVFLTSCFEIHALSEHLEESVSGAQYTSPTPSGIPERTTTADGP
jgi:hypothetical protein